MADAMRTRTTPFRVIQWATGSIGQIAIRHLASTPGFELVGVYVTSEAKHGRDAGDVAGIGPLGVTCTMDKDEILALDADCVNYAPLYFDVDEMCAILRSGKNLVTPAGFAYPLSRDPDETARLEAACRDGGTSLHGAGIHPGFIGDVFALTSARLMSRIDQVVVTEIYVLAQHPSHDMNFPGLGFGRDPVDAVANPSPIIHTMEGIFRESMALFAAGLGLDVDEYVYELEVAVADEDMTVKSGFIPKGTVAGMHHRWEAIVGGKPVIVFQSFARMGDAITPRYDHGPNRYIVEFFGDEPTRLTLEPINSDMSGDIGFTGRVWTAMSAVNLIPQVVAAPPGIRTHLDLPLGQPRGLVRAPSQ
ncbi:MAG TPA: dihydrodipicolinate reductase [Acidimicrobiia bacterium]|nr:dihydrodipicolinate reductase [Acidimicrobiia bacterium]